MAVQFKTPGIPLFKSSSIPAMDADCCCDEDCDFTCPPTYTTVTFTTYTGFSIVGFSCSAFIGTFVSSITQIGAICVGGVSVACGDPSSSTLEISLAVNTGIVTVGLTQFGQGQGSYDVPTCPPSTHNYYESGVLVLTISFS